MKRIVRNSERGFSLLEVLVALVIGSVVVAGLFGTMIMQQQSYFAQMELSEASQNARAALDIIRQNLRSAGWGLIATSSAQGIPAVGTCYASVLTDQSTCNDLPALNANGSTILSDRLRLVGINPGPTFTRNTTWVSPTSLQINDDTREKLNIGDLAIISGQCTAPVTAAYNGVVKVTSVSISSPTVSYTVDPNVAGYPPMACTTMGSGYAFGLGHIVEFYIDRNTANPDPSAGATNIPRLMMMVNRNGLDPATKQLPLEQVVSYDIENLQARYGLDCGHVDSTQNCAAATAPDPDDIIDKISSSQTYCNDLRNTNCSTGLSDLENQMRVMAVQVAVVPRTRNLSRRMLNAETTTYVGATLNVYGSVMPADAYRHWIYRATVALRNNQLAVTTP